MNRACTTAAIASLIATAAHAQTVVDYTTTGWTNFGSMSDVGLVGNFLPGWTSVNATPDIGTSLFFIPVQSLSGAADDSAIWMNQFMSSGTPTTNNEVVRLSLDGFTVGQTYELSFYATLVLSTPSGWTGNNESLDVSIVGADIADWDSTTLVDSGDSDGLNEWVEQTISFTAMSDTVSFDFSGNAQGPDGATRLGIDGFSAALVPAPTSATLLALGALATTSRRRH